MSCLLTDVDQIRLIHIDEEPAIVGMSAEPSPNNLFQKVMGKADYSDRDFTRKSTRNMARDVAHTHIDEGGEDTGEYARDSSTDSGRNLMHSALEKSKSDSDFRRDSTRSATKNAAQALMFKAEGNSAARKGNFKEAIENYTRAIEIDPENSGYFACRSAVYLKMGNNSNASEHVLALEDANTSIQLDPKLAKAHRLKGEALLALERYDQALMHTRKV